LQQALGGMTPEDKHAALVALQKGDAVIAMVGDGVNDAPVLAQAQVSVAMGGGTDLARNQADIVLLSGRTSRLAGGGRHACPVVRWPSSGRTCGGRLPIISPPYLSPCSGSSRPGWPVSACRRARSSSF
jgi:hypothetical protein